MKKGDLIIPNIGFSCIGPSGNEIIDNFCPKFRMRSFIHPLQIARIVNNRIILDTDDGMQHYQYAMDSFLPADIIHTLLFKLVLNENW
jgi:hypothetical protein